MHAENVRVDLGRRRLEELLEGRQALGRLARVVGFVVGTQAVMRILGVSRVRVSRVRPKPRRATAFCDGIHAATRCTNSANRARKTPSWKRNPTTCRRR